ncbi:hypothetical protein KX816_05330 [Sphingosinicellaceae bacterium]|nr:hypothetical protein KX816_05330 [Sphingosinicellaceae bacterium]
MLELVRQVKISGTVDDWPQTLAFLKGSVSPCVEIDRLQHPQTSSKVPELLLSARYSKGGGSSRGVAASVFANCFDAPQDGSPRASHQLIMIDGVACDADFRGYRPSLSRDMIALAVCQIACCDFDQGRPTAVIARIPSSAEGLRFELAGLGAVVVPPPHPDWRLPGTTSGKTFLSLEDRSVKRSAELVSGFHSRNAARRASRTHRGGARLHVELELPWLRHMAPDIIAMALGELQLGWSASNLLARRSIGQRLRMDDQRGGDDPN